MAAFADGPLGPRGEMATLAFDQALEESMSAEPQDRYPIFDDLLNEAFRRNLDLKRKEK